MSAGAVFKLIANDGKADRMIMATKLLNQRIKDVMCARKRAGKADITPTLVDLERTHIIYVNAHFKPFAAIGYEYNKVRPQSGTVVLGSGVTFSIPQFGDFFHDMVVRTRLAAFQSSALTTPVQGTTAAFPVNVVASATAGTFYNLVDSCGNLLMQGATGSQTDPLPNPSSVSYHNLVRYCEYPGNRLFRNVKFDVNGNPLDEYSDIVPVMLTKFCLPPGKEVGFKRLVGQEVPLEGYTGVHCCPIVDGDNTNDTPNNHSEIHIELQGHGMGLYNDVSGGNNAFTYLQNGAIDFARDKIAVVNGPQTPKPIQPPLEIWNKLRFWFNDDVRLAIASVSIPFGQRFITIELAQTSLLAFEFPNLYLETIVESAAASPVCRVKSYTPIFQKGTIPDISIEKMELYVNNIFVNPEVHDIFIKRIGFSLIRVYRVHTARVNQDGTDERLLSQLKWPIEYMFVGMRPVWNIKDITATSGFVTGGNQQVWRDWHRMTKMVDGDCDHPDLAEVSKSASTLMTVTNDGAGTDPVAIGAVVEASKFAGACSAVGQVIHDSYALPVPTIDTLTLTAHGITIFDTFQDKFFSEYMPYHFGGPALITPDDMGALFLNFALFPRSYQPSGHLNISRARETYLKWTSSYVSSRTPADLFAVGVAINFLLVTDGSAVLRYST